MKRRKALKINAGEHPSFRCPSMRFPGTYCGDPTCPGWAVFNDDVCPEIQRCDECCRFGTDEAAFGHILACDYCYNVAAVLRRKAAA